MTRVGTGGIAVETAVALLVAFINGASTACHDSNCNYEQKSLLVTINGGNNVNINICVFGASAATGVSDHNSNKQQSTNWGQWQPAIASDTGAPATAWIAEAAIVLMAQVQQAVTTKAIVKVNNHPTWWQPAIASDRATASTSWHSGSQW